LFKRTCDRIEVRIKENFKRKPNLSDQLNNNNNKKYSYPARETNNFEEEEETQMHGRSNKAKLPETQDNATRTGESGHANVNKGTR
jgi:hypothetical protein